jgi:hypothetical protein
MSTLQRRQPPSSLTGPVWTELGPKCFVGGARFEDKKIVENRDIYPQGHSLIPQPLKAIL